MTPVLRAFELDKREKYSIVIQIYRQLKTKLFDLCRLFFLLLHKQGAKMTNTEKIFEFTSAVRGFHFYRQTWNPQEEEVLQCLHEIGNIFDVFAIKTVGESGEIVGHLPREISRVSKFLLDRGASIKATLTRTNYRRSPLVQGGLEIACKVTVRMPGTVRNHLLLDRYTELVSTLYAEPKEEVIIGSYLVKGPAIEISLPKRKKKSKDLAAGQPKRPRRDGDIRTLFANAAAKTKRPSKPENPSVIPKTSNVPILLD